MTQAEASGAMFAGHNLRTDGPAWRLGYLPEAVQKKLDSQIFPTFHTNRDISQEAKDETNKNKQHMTI